MASKILIIYTHFIYGFTCFFLLIVSSMLWAEELDESQEQHHKHQSLVDMSHYARCKHLSLLTSDRIARTRWLSIKARLLEEPQSSWHRIKPFHDLSVSEAKQTKVLLMMYPVLSNAVSTNTTRVNTHAKYLGIHQSDDNGWFQLDFTRLNIVSGDWNLAWFYVKESQSVDQVICKITDQKIRFLKHVAKEVKPVIIRSDLDMTYLYTAFHKTRDILNLLNQNAMQRKPIKGMPDIYRALHKSQTQKEQVRPRPITFLSGSPFFFFRTLMARLDIDHIPIDDIRLKPFKAMIKHEFVNLTPHKLKSKLKDQLTYKLLTLLRMRLDLPVGWQEVLIGDDQESDLMIYQIYHAITAQKITLDQLLNILTQESKSKINMAWYHQLKKVVQQVWSYREASHWGNAVHSIFIHQSKSSRCKKKTIQYQKYSKFNIKVHQWVAQKATRQSFPNVYLYCNASEFAQALQHSHLLDQKDIRYLQQSKAID